MLDKAIDREKFGVMFSHLEMVLNFGTYSRNLVTNEVYWSKGLYRILGLEENEIAPTMENFIKYVVPEDAGNIKELARTGPEKKQDYEVEFSIINAQGVHKRIYAETIFKKESDGTIVEYNGVVKDITENHEFKKALEEKVLQLDKSNKNLQEFVYVASHDLQEPVRKISTFAERLNSKFGDKLGDEGLMYLKRMQNASLNMQTLLEDLLNFSRLSFNDKPFEKVSLKECLEAAISDLEVKIEETRTQIEYGELPVVEGYFGQLKQLFNNLLGNAIKFKKPEEDVRIKIICTRVNPYSYPLFPLLKNTHYTKIEISDNGIGFEPEYSERIFMIFQRLNSKADYSGSGIGLSICKRIVENHHGCIFANGLLHKGSTFTVLLPYTIS